MRIQSAVHCYTVQWWGYSQQYIVTQFSDEDTVSNMLLPAVCCYTVQWWEYSQQYIVTSSTLLHSSVMRIQSAVCCYTVQWWGYSQQYVVTVQWWEYSQQYVVTSSMLLHSSVMRIQSAVRCYTVQWWGYSQQYVVTHFIDEDTVSSSLLCGVQNFELSEIVPLMEKWCCVWSNHTLNKIVCVTTEFSYVLWEMWSYNLVCRWQCFVATCHPHIQGCLVTPSISQSSVLAWGWWQQYGLLKHWYLCRSLHRRLWL